MIEVTCQACGAHARVESLLDAAQHPCRKCGGLLMGPLARSTRKVRPQRLARHNQPFEQGPASRVPIWLGIVAGAFAGIAVVNVVDHLGTAIPLPQRGALLGALSGVLLAPVVAVLLLLLKFLGPMSLLGILGDSAWERLATAVNERRLRHLVVPLFVFVVLPMALCGLGGSRSKVIDSSILASAVLGAVFLGAFVGGVCGALARKVQSV
jgi:hypothetical protein